MVKRILVSQQPPKTPAPYEALTAKYGVQFDFKPFFLTQPVSCRDFRVQRINILDHTAIVFSSRSMIDAFFKICSELRVKIPETMKYFCTTEAVAMYLQKHIVYRKRKIFYGKGDVSSVLAQIGTKHKNEKFLVTSSDTAENDLTKAFGELGLNFACAVFLKTVTQDLKDVDISSYDMIVLYNKADVESLFANFPEFRQGDIKFVSYGKSAEKAIEDHGLEVAIHAPSAEAPSVARAVEIYLEQNS